MQAQYKGRRTLLFRYEQCINFWLRFFDTTRETQFLLCWPYYLTPQTQCILQCLRSLSVKICKTLTTCLNGRKLNSLCPNGKNSIICLYGPTSNFNCMVGLQLLNTMVGPRLLNTMVRPQLLDTMVRPQLLDTMVRPQILDSMAENSILCPNGRNSIVCLHGPISNPQLNLFQNLPNSHLISSGHDVIYTPAPFPGGVSSWCNG